VGKNSDTFSQKLSVPSDDAKSLAGGGLWDAAHFP